MQVNNRYIFLNRGYFSVQKYACLWAILVLAGCHKISSEQPPEVVATVNGEPITATEYRILLNQHKARVHGYYHRRYRITDEAHFWRTKLGDSLPEEALQQKALQAAIRIKVEMLQARAKKVQFEDNLQVMGQPLTVTDVSYAAFQQYYRAYRQAAQKASQREQAFYGPTGMPEAEKYLEYCGRISQALRQKVAQELEINDVVLQEYYTGNKQLFETAGYHECRQLVLYKAPGQSSALKEKLSQIEKLIRQGVPFAKLVRQYSEESTKRQTQGLVHISAGLKESMVVPTVAQAAQALQPGQISPVIKTPEAWYLVQLLKSKPTTIPNWQTIKTSLQAAWVAEKYEREIIPRWVQEAKVQTFPAVLRQTVEASL